MTLLEKVNIGLDAAKWCARAVNMLRPPADFAAGKVTDDERLVSSSSAEAWAEQNHWTVIRAAYEQAVPTPWAIIYPDNDELTVAFRGTSSATDWITYNSPLWDAAPQAMEFFREGHWKGNTYDLPDFPSQLANGPALQNTFSGPAGFLMLYFVLRQQVIAKYKAFFAHQRPTKINIYGHSLGCTVAQYLYAELVDLHQRDADLKHKTRPKFVVGLLASPRCFERSKLPKIPDGDTVLRFAVLLDPVPDVPKLGVTRDVFKWEWDVTRGSIPFEEKELTALGELVQMWGAGDARTQGLLTHIAIEVLQQAGFVNVSNAISVWSRRIFHHFIEVYRDSLLAMVFSPEQPGAELLSANLEITTSSSEYAGTDEDVVVEFAGMSQKVEGTDLRYFFRTGQKATLELPISRGWNEERLRETQLVVWLSGSRFLAPQWKPERLVLTYEAENVGTRRRSFEFPLDSDFWVIPKDPEKHMIVRSVWPVDWQRPLLLDRVVFTLSDWIEDDSAGRHFFDIAGNPQVADNGVEVLAFLSKDMSKRNTKFFALFVPEKNAYRIVASEIKSKGQSEMSIHLENRSLDGHLVLHEFDQHGHSFEFWRFLPLGDGGYHICSAERSDLFITKVDGRLFIKPLRHGRHREAWRLTYV